MNEIKSFQKIESLYIETGIGNVFLMPGSGEEVVVRAEHVSEDFRCEQQETLLKVLDGPKERYHSFAELKSKFSKRSKIVIEIPVKTRLKKLETEIGIGNLEVKKVRVEELNVDCGIGKIFFGGLVEKSADIDCGIGNIKMVLYNSKEDFNYVMDIGIGSISFDGNGKGGLGVDKTISHQAEHNIKADCGIGKIHISFRKRVR